MRRLVVLAVLSALAVTVPAGPVTARPAPARGTNPGTATAAHRSAPVPVRATITFDKAPGHPFRSRIVWRAFRRQADGSWRRTEQASWRAGSGFGGPDTTHECVRGKGWLPNGQYSFVQHDDYAGSLIKGRAFYLGNKACSNGTLRTELFIHTETGAGNHPCANTRGDQVCRWEWPAYNDYRSAGCIKMSPRDLLALTRRYHRYFHAGVRYPTSRVVVRVVP